MSKFKIKSVSEMDPETLSKYKELDFDTNNMVTQIQLLAENGYCEYILIETTPAEFLVLNKALKQFAENKDNHPIDIQLAKNMESTIIQVFESEDKE